MAGNWVRLSAAGIEQWYAQGRGTLLPQDVVQALLINDVGVGEDAEQDVRIRVMTANGDCHVADALSPSRLKHLLKAEGGAAE